MGNARWSHSDWSQHSTRTQTQSQEQIFTQSGMAEELDPSKIKFRESVDSESNPASTPIILACDETGSMGILAETIIKTGLGKIMKSIYTHKPVTDPHICCMGVGDAFSDRAPLQVTQFEASVAPLVDQVQKIYIEKNGGGNNGESYPLAWWFAAYKVKSDSYQKRKKKGYLFTIGDEQPHAILSKDQIIRFLGVGCEKDVPISELLKIVQDHWHVYHLIVNPVTYQPVVDTWKSLLGERVVQVKDHEKLAEYIVTLISINEQVSVEDVLNDFDNETKTEIKQSAQHLLTAGAV